MVKNKRMAGLDLFRLLAALVVFLFHSQAHMGCRYGIADGFVSMGAIFMTGFFLLSGYTLMAVYQNKPLAEKTQRNQFYCKRFFGIFPVYYVVGLVHTLFLAWEEPFYRVLLVPIELLGLQSVFSSLFSFAHNSGTWFISCLVLCYLLYPFLQECVKEMAVKWKWLLLVICGFVILYAPLIVHHFGIASIYTNPFFRILEFLIGILLASEKDRLHSCKKLRPLFGWPAFLVELVVLFAGVSVGIRLDIGTGNYMLYN